METVDPTAASGGGDAKSVKVSGGNEKTDI